MTVKNDRDVSVGSQVDVWCRFTQRWGSQFRVAAVENDQVWVEHLSDPGEVLPVSFAADDVRPAH